MRNTAMARLNLGALHCTAYVPSTGERSSLKEDLQIASHWKTDEI
jgi:hypothetical protein